MRFLRFAVVFGLLMVGAVRAQSAPQPVTHPSELVGVWTSPSPQHVSYLELNDDEQYKAIYEVRTLDAAHVTDIQRARGTWGFVDRAPVLFLCFASASDPRVPGPLTVDSHCFPFHWVTRDAFTVVGAQGYVRTWTRTAIVRN